MGRNMFGPIRGEWDGDWRGWWGDDPPYHAPVFVLTHHAREPIEMEGGTTFHFVTEGFDAALELASGAGDGDVDIAGGASTPSARRSRPASSTNSSSTSPRCCWARASGSSTAWRTRRSSRSEVLPSPDATHVRYRVG